MKPLKKRLLSGTLAWVLLAALCLSACNGTNEEVPESETLSDTPETAVSTPAEVEPVEDDDGFPDMSGMTVQEVVEAYGFYVSDEDGSGGYTTGDTVYFGSYPQTMVTEEGTLAALEEKTGALPTAASAGDWTNCRYYDDGEQADYAFYRDVTVDGEKYRGVYLLAYRPYYAKLAATGDGSYIDDNGLALETVYWYRYDPIAWTVLTYDGAEGTVLLASQYSLDAQPFQALYEYTENGSVVIPGTEIPVNDWEASTVRAFLNGEFLNGTFSDFERTLIQRVAVDNHTTGYAADAPYQQDQNDTSDKVFLLSCTEVQNKDYGYSSKGVSRVRSYTDYAASQGVRASTQSFSADGQAACCYLLRSAGAQSGYTAVVNKMGSVSSDPGSSNNVVVDETTVESVDGLAYNGDMGVLPALKLRVAPNDDGSSQGEWAYSVYDYIDKTGADAQLNYGVYVPAAYREGDALPLVAYIPDASYVGKSVDKVVKAQCPVNWATEGKMREHPCFFLVFSFTETSSSVNVEGSEGAQIVPVIQRVAEEYGIDRDRLYLTGQSMGGITDFALNDAYPDMFAATVYVGCQPGDEVGDAQYNEILDRGTFLNQKFVYIVSRMDEKAPYGQDDVETALAAAGKDYGKLYDLDHKGGDELEAAVRQVLSRGCGQNLLGFTQLTSSGDGVAEHMQSFKYSYSIDALFDWLAYPFGYGLSYTTFDEKITDAVQSGGEIAFTITASNTGAVAGKDVIELYVQKPYTNGGVEVPQVELIGFAKTEVLDPGGEQTVTLTVKEEDLASYDSSANSGAGCYVLAGGEYAFYLASATSGAHCWSSHKGDAARCKSFSITKVEYSGDNKRSTDAVTAVNLLETTDNDTGVASNDTTAGYQTLSRADSFANAVETISKEANTRGGTINGSVELDSGSTLYQALTANYGNNTHTNFNAGHLADVSEFTDPSVEQEKRYVLADLYTTDADGAALRQVDRNTGEVTVTGVDYDDPRWETLISQMSVAEMEELIGRGGYGTIAVESIEKLAATDYDGPTGFSNFLKASLDIEQDTTGFCSEPIMAATWNVELLEEYGLAVGMEGNAFGNNGWYAPGMNIHRTTFEGRTGEYFSEDPYITGMAAAAVAGGAFQNGVYTYAKHFAFNELEANRSNGMNCVMNEQTAREIYLRPFELAIKQGKLTGMMSSFMLMNAQWNGGNFNLMHGIVRTEWGFKGIINTDLAGSSIMGAERALCAGTDMLLATSYGQNARSAYLRCDTIKETDEGICAMKTAVKHILYAYASAALNRAVAVSEVDSSAVTALFIAINVIAYLGAAVLAGVFVWRFMQERKIVVLDMREQGAELPSDPSKDKDGMQ